MTERGFFSGQRVLVAGGTGLIGTPLVKRLIAQGAYVRIASLDHPSRAHAQAEFCQVDLTWLEHCLNVCTGMDYVFNLLCIKGSPALVQARPASMLVPMLLFNTNLLEAARRQKVKGYLFTSSVAVYPPAEVFYEAAVWDGFPSRRDWFASWAKRIGELQVTAYALEYGWRQLVIVRPANVYGPYDSFDSPSAQVVPALIQRALAADSTLTVWGDGTAERDFIYADDVAKGMLLAMTVPPGADWPINLGSGRSTSIRQLVKTIVSCLDKELKVIWDTSRPAGDHKRIMDISRARALGFSPAVPLAEGLRRTIAWYRANPSQAGQRYDLFNQSST